MVEKDTAEFGLVDSWIALKRRRFIVLSMTVACAILAVVYSIYSRTFEEDIVFEVGIVGGTRIEEIRDVVSRLRGTYVVEKQKRDRKIPHVTVVVADNSVISIAGAGPDSNSIADFLERVVGQLVEKHAEMAEKHRNGFVYLRSALQRQVELLRGAVAVSSPAITVVPSNLAGVFELKPYALLIDAENRLVAVERQLADPRDLQTSMLQKPQRAPSRFPVLLVIVGLFIGIGVGLVIGTAAAMALEIGGIIGTAARARSVRA